jgi:hypothetical protein
MDSTPDYLSNDIKFVIFGRIVGDIPNGYTSDVVLNQQARVVHGGGMADCLPGGPVAGKPMADTRRQSLWWIRR